MNMEHDRQMYMAIARIRDDLFEGIPHTNLRVYVAATEA